MSLVNKLALNKMKLGKGTSLFGHQCMCFANNREGFVIFGYDIKRSIWTYNVSGTPNLF